MRVRARGLRRARPAEQRPETRETFILRRLGSRCRRTLQLLQRLRLRQRSLIGVSHTHLRETASRRRPASIGVGVRVGRSTSESIHDTALAPLVRLLRLSLSDLVLEINDLRVYEPVVIFVKFAGRRDRAQPSGGHFRATEEARRMLGGRPSDIRVLVASLRRS